MDREVIDQKLESLRRCIQRIEDKRPVDPKTLLHDLDLQDIIAINLTRSIQLCVDIGAHIIASKDVSAPDTMGQTFDVLAQVNVINTNLATQLKKAVGFRNIAVHNYEEIDWNIVHALTVQNLDDFSEFAKIIASMPMT